MQKNHMWPQGEVLQALLEGGPQGGRNRDNMRRRFRNGDVTLVEVLVEGGSPTGEKHRGKERCCT